MAEVPHSEHILTDARDGWWNRDFLHLMAARLGLGGARRVLDVGAGQGHWGRLWAPHLAPDATVLGVEREPRWVVEASARAAALGLSDRFTYRQGTAEALPVPDAAFDLVTCQTLLMHVADPVVVLAEMVRALRPGGRLLVAEPNNLVGPLARDSVRQGLGVEGWLTLVRFHAVCNAGRAALGEGDHAIGDRLPQLLADQGLVEVQVFLNDKAAPLLGGAHSPPSDWRAMDQAADNIERGAWLWSRPAAWRLYGAGGGTEAAFERDFAAFMDDAHAHVRAVRDRSYRTAGGAQHFLVSARRP